MTPSQQAKAAGCKSLAEVSMLTGVPVRTLERWSKIRPELFEVVLVGVVNSRKVG